MPPIWLILGIGFVFVFWWLADRLVLRPRAASVIVDGREVLVRRKRDSLLLIAGMMALFMGVVVVGAFIEEDAGLLPLAVLFGGFMLGALWRATRATEKQASDEEARRVQASSREAWILVPLSWLCIVLLYASGANGGVLNGILVIANLVLSAVVFYLLWRVWRRWLENRHRRHPI
jgi:uncharacterized membrane-anchored protein